jgi:hypothetical protein
LAEQIEPITGPALVQPIHPILTQQYRLGSNADTSRRSYPHDHAPGGATGVMFRDYVSLRALTKQKRDDSESQEREK